MSGCRVCGNRLSRENKSGLCRTHFNQDPEWAARRIEALKLAFKTRPELREKQRKHMVELNRSTEARARSAKQAREIRLWEHGLAKVDDEVRQRAAKTLSERRLAHIPREYRDLYADLIRKDFKAKEAARLVAEHIEADLEKFRRSLAA